MCVCVREGGEGRESVCVCVCVDREGAFVRACMRDRALM